jgi:hypothetical protein
MRPQRAPFCDALAPVPARAGAGVKPAHYRDLLASKPSLAFVEVHPENYMGQGGPPHAYLEAVASHYPLSFHGVGLSLAGAEPLDRAHLARWRVLVDRYQPALISEHIAWSRFGGVALHDLLPIPYTAESLDLVCDHIDEMQNALKRRILVENPSSYVSFAQSQIPEAEFMVEAAERSGCGLLLDINNVYVSASNHGFDARHWLADIPGELVGEIHLAGHSVVRDGNFQIRVDDHGSRTCAEVWKLYRETIARIGPKPTLIEWDTDVPELAVLCDEAKRADAEAAAAMESAHAAA